MADSKKPVKSSRKPIRRAVLEHHPEEAALLGMIIIEWNAIEIAFVSLLAVAMTTKPSIIYPMAYALQNNRARLDLVGTALDKIITDNKHRKTLESILQEARKVLQMRNVYTHGFYVNGKNRTLRRLVMSEDLGTQKGNIPVTKKELQLAFNRMIKLRNRVFRFGGKVFPPFWSKEQPPASPEPEVLLPPAQGLDHRHKVQALGMLVQPFLPKP